MVVGQYLTQRRKGAKKTEDKYVIATAARGSWSCLPKTPLRLSDFA
jgi:hypothetical protein